MGFSKPHSPTNQQLTPSGRISDAVRGDQGVHRGRFERSQAKSFHVRLGSRADHDATAASAPGLPTAWFLEV